MSDILECQRLSRQIEALTEAAKARIYATAEEGETYIWIEDRNGDTCQVGENSA